MKLSASTACLLMWYAAAYGFAVNAAIDAVLTMCPSSPRSSMIGTNVRMPWIAPHMLTPSTHS